MARLGMLRVELVEGCAMYVEAATVIRVEEQRNAVQASTGRKLSACVVHLADGSFWRCAEAAADVAMRYDRLVMGFPPEAEGNPE